MTLDKIQAVEINLIGSLILDNESYYRIDVPLSSKNFTNLNCLKIYEFILECVSENKKWDMLLTISSLEEKYPETDWKCFILDCTDNVVSSALINTYAKRIIEFTTYRNFETKLKSVSSELNVENISESKLDLINYLSQSESTLEKETIEDSHIDSILNEYTLKIQNQDKGERTLYLNSGFKDYDYLIEGFGPGSMNIIAARPGGGKSTLALNISTRMALQLREEESKYSNYPVVFFALEMTKTELLKREISNFTGIDHSKIRKEDPSFIRGNIVKIAEANRSLSKLNLIIFDQIRSCAEMRMKLNKIKAKHGGIGVFFVDYLQIMKHKDTRFSKADQIGETTMEIKRMSQDFHCPSFVLSQLNRGIEGRDDKAPKMSDLRDSGAIESDADSITFVSSQNESGVDFMQIDIAKNRHGRGEGITKLKWKKETFSLFDRDEKQSNLYPSLYISKESQDDLLLN